MSMVMGLEPKKPFLEGIEVLLAIGVNVIPFVWAANPALTGRPPSTISRMVH